MPDLSREGAGVVDTRRGAHFRLQAVPVGAVRLAEGSFWELRRERNRTVGIPEFLDRMEQHGVVDNFRRASGRSDGEYRAAGFVSESDLYKWVEAASFVLQSGDDPVLRARLDAVLDEIAAAQGPDGYLYLQTERGAGEPYERFSRLVSSHELYCAGHLLQAGLAHWRATGEDRLLSVGRRFADYLVSVFGPGKREETDGHPEIELALVELYRATGERAYLDLAGFFLSLPQPAEQLPPLAERPALAGHVVRSGYLCSGGADWHAETGDARMWENLLRLWEDLVGAKLYVTGGVGARYDGEAFGDPWELPPRAYAETCAQISHVMWAWRMLLISGEARFADVMEQILYNGFLSGISLRGGEYFYRNPLTSEGGYGRVPWFGCNCCPPNAQRMLASLPGYMFSTSEEGLWVHLYDAAHARFTLSPGREVGLRLRTRYPWQGTVELEVEVPEPTDFTLRLRIPGWAAGATATVSPEALSGAVPPGSYLALRRPWQDGDRVRLDFPLPVRLVESHPRVAESRGAVALCRGPLVYCVESADHPGLCLADLSLPATGDPEGGFRAQWEGGLLDGVAVLRGPGLVPAPGEDPGPLYCRRHDRPPQRTEQVEVQAIPCYAWANRGDSAMRVWLPLRA